MTVPYDQIVFIGYVIDTAPKEEPNGKETYLGLPDPIEDIDARCQLMSGALQVALGALPPPASPPVKTLNVFVAPEFFFRGKTGAYTMDQVQHAIESVQAIAADAEWDDWAFVFGTIVGQWETDDPRDKIQIVNFALFQQGGLTEQGADGARVIVKELKSGIDFIADAAHPGGLLLGAVEHPEAADPVPGSARQLAAYDGAGIFEALDITWATDICLDHLERRLQQSPHLPGESEVQVQLVPSCGADVDAGVIAQPGGYIFNADGYRWQAHATLVQSAMPPVNMVRTAAVAVNIDSVTLAGLSPPKTVPVSDLYASGSGSIWVYQPVPVPPAQTVPGSYDVYAWAASDKPLWTFTFYLIYDENGEFTTALCKIRSDEKGFKGNNYYLPLPLQDLTFPAQPPDIPERHGSIWLDLRTGQGSSYEFAIYGEINVPGFNFQGDLMQFMSSKNSTDPVQTSW